MDRLAHNAVAAMRAAMARQAATAHNLANSSVAGFRADTSASQTVWLQSGGRLVGARATEAVSGYDMTPGTVSETGRSLDVALNGDALLAVQADNGEESYTRRGDLQVSDSGLVTTGDGRPVMAEGGPLTLPPYDSLRIDDEGKVWIVPRGGDPDNPTQVDRLKLVSPTGSNVVKGLDGLFRVRGGGTLPSDPEARVTSGSLEGSNVNVTNALVEMIEASRAWDTQVKLVSSAKELDTSATDLMRLPG